MSIKKDSVVTFNYTLKDDAGEVIDSSSEGEPLAYLQGHGNLVPGLEREMEGKSAGDKWRAASLVSGLDFKGGQARIVQLQRGIQEDGFVESRALQVRGA